MKKLLALCIIGLVATFSSYTSAEDTVTMECDPPTHRSQDGDCLATSTPLTPEEIQTLEYTFSYRQKGSGLEWTNVESMAPSAVVTFPGYGVTYEVSVGAHFAGEAVLCATPLVEYTTKLNTNPPGACTNLLVTDPR